MGTHSLNMIEALESRRLFSAATIVGGVLRVTAATDGVNTINVDISPDGSEYQIQVSSHTLHGKAIAGMSIPFPTNGVRSVRIIGGNFGDTVVVGSLPVPVTILEGKGNDSISSDAVRGAIYDASGNDTIQVGDGNNLIQLGAGTSTVTAGDGNNRIVAGVGTQQISVGDGINTIIGGQGTQTITAGDGDNSITAGGGAVNITVGDGDNLILGGTGTDTIVAGNGNNILWAGSGHDTIVAGAGDNIFGVSTGSHTMAGGAGDNTFIAPDRPTFARQHTNYDAKKDRLQYGKRRPSILGVSRAKAPSAITYRDVVARFLRIGA